MLKLGEVIKDILEDGLELLDFPRKGLSVHREAVMHVGIGVEVANQEVKTRNLVPKLAIRGEGFPDKTKQVHTLDTAQPRKNVNVREIEVANRFRPKMENRDPARDNDHMVSKLKVAKKFLLDNKKKPTSPCTAERGTKDYVIGSEEIT